MYVIQTLSFSGAIVDCQRYNVVQTEVAVSIIALTYKSKPFTLIATGTLCSMSNGKHGFNHKEEFVMAIKVMLSATVLLITLTTGLTAAENTPAPSNGISYPAGWQDWGALAVAHRVDNNTIRVILGNDVALRAAREGNTNPWPDKAILGKVVWKEKRLADWEDAVVPGELVHAEFMFKDSQQYKDSYGWGWARWLGAEQKPFDKGAGPCISCHTPVEERDWVFTEPAVFPK